MDLKNSLCAQCGRQIEVATLSGDFCSECAAKIHRELTLGFQIKELWMRVGERLQRVPAVTLFFVVINAAVYCFIEANYFSGRGQTFVAILEMQGTGVIRGQWWRLITSAFLHVQPLHLISNLVLLCLLGWAAEPLFGHAKFLVLWITCGIAGSIAQLLTRQAQSIGYGASGVVYGLIGALLYLYLFKQEIPPLRPRFRRILLLSMFVVLNLFGEWYVFGSPIPAHVGGLVAGFLFPLLVPLVNDISSKRILAGLAALAAVLSITTLIVIRRQKVWLELDELDPAGISSAGISSVNLGSISQLERIVRNRSDILRAHILLAEAYQNDHRYEDAIREHRYVLRKQPLFQHVWYRMGWAYMGLERHEEAIDAFSHALKIDTSESKSQATHEALLKIAMDHVALAKAYEGAGRIGEAITEYKEVLQLDPDDYFAQQELPRLEQLVRPSSKGHSAGQSNPR